MKIASVLLATALIVVSTSCDKHSWSQTQTLHEGMHKDHHGDGHHDDAHKDEHHGEAKKDAHAPAAEAKH